MKFFILIVLVCLQTIGCIRAKFDLFSFFAKSDNINMTELNSKESKTTVDAINQKSSFVHIILLISFFASSIRYQLEYNKNKRN